MGGGMEVHKNRWIEEWNAGRENLEFNFRWTRRSLAVVGLFGLAVPILVYKGIVREFVIHYSEHLLQFHCPFPLSPNPKINFLFVPAGLDPAYAGRGCRSAIQEVPVSGVQGCRIRRFLDRGYEEGSFHSVCVGIVFV
jgi:hypothetical protein